MFNYCTFLTQAPELPATELAIYCYTDMFNGCISLNSIKIGYTGNYRSSYFINWVTGVASSGTFYYESSDSTQDFGFPEGLTVVPN